MEDVTHLLLQVLILQIKDTYFSYKTSPKHWLIALSDVQPKKMLFIPTNEGKTGSLRPTQRW